MISNKFSQKFFTKRRAKLLEIMEPQSLALIPAKSNSAYLGSCSFQQDSNFYYLTNLLESDAIAVLSKDAQNQTQYFLFVQKKDPAKEKWEGELVGVEAAVSEYGADFAYPITEFPQKIAELLRKTVNLYFTFGEYPQVDNLINQNLQQNFARQREPQAQIVQKIYPLNTILGEMRIIKDELELENLRKAAKISVSAHLQAMQQVRSCEYEYQLEAKLWHEFKFHGGDDLAYPNIVGAGKNSCILHYHQNQAPLISGDLVLIDAGVKYSGYCADITRTFPVSGKFSPQQKAVYEIVLAAQQAGIAVIKPGAYFADIQAAIVRVLTQGLINLGFLQGNLDDLIAQQAYLPFYMHKSGHWLGLDVHDVGRYYWNGESRRLEPGMVLTVEPGLYLSSDLKIPTEWHNIGIRIEDDIVVTEQGAEILTQDLPKTISAIEAVIQ